MALIRNIAGVHKLGLMAETSPDMARILPDDGYGGGGGGSYGDSYQEPDYNPPRDIYTPPDVINPDDADNIDVGDVHPVYPIEPIYHYEDEPAPPDVPVNTVQVTNVTDQQQVDITAIGAIAIIIGMALGLRPKGVLGGIMYAGACGLLWMQLHYQTPGLGTDPRKA